MLTGEGGICDTDSSALQKYVLRVYGLRVSTVVGACLTPHRV